MATEISKAVICDDVSVTLTLAGTEASGDKVTPTALNANDLTLTQSTTPPVKYHLVHNATPAGSGAATETIQLDSFTDIEGNTVDGDGLKVQVLRVICPDTNSAVVTIGPGASNPYNLFGAGNELDVPPGGRLLMQFDAELDAIESNSGTIATDVDIDMTGGDEVTVEMLIG